VNVLRRAYIMASIAAEIKERLGAVRDLLKTLRQITTAVMLLSRLLRRLLNRKKALPDEKDLGNILTLVANLIKTIGLFSSIPSKLQAIWRI